MDRVVFMPAIDKKVVPDYDGFKVAPEAVESKWLRKILDKVFGFMHKKGYITTRTTTEYVYKMNQVTIDLDKVDEQIAMNQHTIEAVYRNQVDTVIMGANIMRKIMSQDPFSMGQVQFQMTRESKFARFAGRNDDMSPRHERVQYRGLNVIMVPWFEGFLLLEKRRDNNGY